MLTDCLAGTRVLDLSQWLPGPMAAQLLADLGADVVKVEPPAGDPMRALGPIDGDGVSAFYKIVNAGKSVVHLDLKSEEGAADLRGLLAHADVLLESFRPGTLAKLGFGREALEILNPALIHCALSGYGQTGPLAFKAGHDIDYMALGGGLATSGTVERPIPAHPPTADFASALQAALATLGALLRRARTGEGAFLDVSLMETVLAWQALSITGSLRDGDAPERGRRLLTGGAACYRLYRTADDRFVALGALEPKFWATFCEAVGRPDWTGRQNDPLPQEALISEVDALLASQPLSHWSAHLADVDCCFEPVLAPSEVPDHPQVSARGLVTQKAGADSRVEVSFAALLDGNPPKPRASLREAQAEDVLAAWR